MAEPLFLLDSNICIYLLKGAKRLTARVADQHAGTLAMSSISLAEIGLGYGNRFDDAAELRALTDHISVLDFDRIAARAYALLPFRRGRFDRLIAAHALSLNLTLITNNERDFENIPGLKVENWTL